MKACKLRRMDKRRNEQAHHRAVLCLLPDVSLEGDVNCSIPVLILFNTCIDIARVLEQYRLSHLCDSSVRDTFVHCSKVLSSTSFFWSCLNPNLES
jgi:hypothetical protein